MMNRSSAKAVRAMGFILGMYWIYALELCAAADHKFAAFNLTIEIDIEDGEIDMTAHFTLPTGSDEIDPVKEVVTLNVTGGKGRYAVTLPAGSFTADRDGNHIFRGRIGKVALDAALRRRAHGAYTLVLETEGADLKGFANPVTVGLTVGKYSDSKSLRALIE